MGSFSVEEKERLEILWRRRNELVGVEGDDGIDGLPGAVGPPGVPGSDGADGTELYITVQNDAEVVQALSDIEVGGGGTMYMANADYYQGIVVRGHNTRIIAAGGAVLHPPEASHGVVLDRVHNCEVSGLTVRDITNAGSPESWGIAVYGGYGNIVAHNKIINGDDAGISIRYDGPSYGALSTADRQDYDLTYEIDGHHHIIIGNYIENTLEGSGIEMARCNDTIVADNVIMDSSQHGIRVLGTSGCIVANNQVDRADPTVLGGAGISIQAFGDAAPVGVTKYTTNTLVTGNRVKSMNPMHMFNGVENLIISDNMLECTGTGDDGSVVLRSRYVDGHISPLSYDVKDVHITGNTMKFGEFSLKLEGDLVGVLVDSNQFLDFFHAGVLADGDVSTTPTSLTNLYVKNNFFRPTTDTAETLKFGIRAESASGSTSIIYYHGNDHFPSAGYTYDENKAVGVGASVHPIDYMWDTGVVAGSYDHADITVDAKGRLTAAADGQMTEHLSWSMGTSSAVGESYMGGFYIHGSTSDDLDPLTSVGNTNSSYAAHAFIVCGEVPVDNITMRVSGTSITDSGVRTSLDTEDISVPSGTAINTYFETSKKWIGSVDLSTPVGTPVEWNYGLCKYWDYFNQDFTVDAFEALWLAGANDSGFDVIIYHHKSAGWTYNSGSHADPPVIRKMSDIHGTERQAIKDDHGAFKHIPATGQAVLGSASEGLIFSTITTNVRVLDHGSVEIRVRS